MKLLIFCLSIAMANISYAELFIIAGTPQEFIPQGKLLLSGCAKQCDALNAIKEHPHINLKEVRKGMKYSNSTGSDVCARVYKADSLLGQAQNRDRRAFCYFKDQSMVEMNSLSAHLIENKIVQE
ncbi:MAG TPA: hypothetical protein VNJ08_14300 [Bacteriovoracaceae bacterium]|nr:hypothetical protein [Bacteriovoracaceae bacterium]